MRRSNPRPSTSSGDLLQEHVPVMLEEVVSFLTPEPIFVDCTLGLGGYAKRILSEFPGSKLFGIDQDGDALAIARANLAEFGERFVPVHGNFRDIEELLAPFGLGNESIGGFVFDLGVSNLQLTESERGFAFGLDGVLDMRMNPEVGEPASYAVNSLPAKQLSDIFRIYGEEKFAWRIACGIEAARKKSKIETTGDLVALIRDILPAPVQRKMGGHPARRVFQALRIYVNGELDALGEALDACAGMACCGAALVAVDYHSLEDRILKHKFVEWRRDGLGDILTKHPLVPSDDEVEGNFKARSAKLRAFRFAGQEMDYGIEY